MRYKLPIALIGLVLIAGCVVVALGVADMRGLVVASEQQIAQVHSAPAQSGTAQSSSVQLIGAYSGSVKLDVAVSGVYSDTLSTPSDPNEGAPAPPDLGSIDLAFQLSQTGNALSGYVNLEKTLVFSAEHTLNVGATSIQIGPYVSGMISGTELSLLSEKVSVMLNGHAVQRQFQLLGKDTANDGSQISGEYRETLWGYASKPITVLGSFTLERPVFDDIAPEATNKTPAAVADTATTAAGAAVTINVLDNDRDANGDALTITSVSKPQFGTATTNGQAVTYTPNDNFIGTDTFSYVASDSKGGDAIGSVTITVSGPDGTSNQPPTAANDTATTSQGNAVTIDVIANDADPNGDALSIIIDGPPSNGTATVEGNKVIYTPKAGFSGTDSFAYIVSDGKGGTAAGVVTVTVSVTASQGGSEELYLPIVQG